MLLAFGAKDFVEGPAVWAKGVLLNSVDGAASAVVDFVFEAPCGFAVEFRLEVHCSRVSKLFLLILCAVGSKITAWVLPTMTSPNISERKKPRE